MTPNAGAETAHRALLRVTAALWHSRRVSSGFVLCFTVWLVVGTWFSLPGRDPWATYEVEIALRRSKDDDLTLQGSVFRDCIGMRRKAFLVGASRLEYRRSSGAEPGFLALSMAVDIPPGGSLRVRNTTSGDELVLRDCPGWMTHLAIPVTGSRVRFDLLPSDERVVYRFPRIISTYVFPPDGRPFELTAFQEYSPALAVKGGTVAIGGGWDFDADDFETKVPGDPLKMRSHAWLKLETAEAGACVVRIPFQKIHESIADPSFEVSGSPIAARISDGVAALHVRVDADFELRISRPGVARHALDVAYVVALKEITIER